MSTPGPAGRTGPTATGAAQHIPTGSTEATSTQAGAAQALPAGPIVVDASYVLALLDDEPAATRLAEVMNRAVLTSVTAGETFYKLAAGSGLSAVDSEQILRSLGAHLIDLPLAAATHFPTLRRIDAARRAEQKHRGEPAATLSLADLCVLGYALAANLPVLTGDRHWSTLHRHGLTVAVHHFRDPELTV